MELDALRVEEITRGGELPCEQLEAIAKQSSSRKPPRPARGPNSWNNFVKDMQQKLPSESKELGLNTRYLSSLWNQLSADKKQQYRRGQRPRMKSKAQLRHATSHLRKDVITLGLVSMIVLTDPFRLTRSQTSAPMFCFLYAITRKEVRVEGFRAPLGHLKR